MKDTFYFSHDYNARSDVKIKRLMAKHGLLGYGIYWAIIEDLYQNANALPLDCESIAFDLRTNEELVESVIKNFDLFVIDGETFGSLSVQRRMDERSAKSAKARESAFRRWNNDAKLMRTHSDGNAIKERKEKEIKEKKSINKEEKEINKEKLVEEKNILLDWLGSNCPRVQKMKQPITFQQAEALLKDYEHELQIMKDVFLDMENYTDLNKKTSANLTIRKWIGLAKERKKGLFNQPKIDRLVWNERKS